MKRIITAFVFIGILLSCNSSDKNKKAARESADIVTVADSIANNANKQLKAIDTDEALIATALMAAPEKSRAGSKVIGYNMAGEFVTLKEGDNEFIILADNPKQVGFNVACYHKDLEPFMARGRTFRAEGKSAQEVNDIREAEMKSGQLKITTGATSHIYYSAKAIYDPKTSKVEEAQLRFVVYMPYATAASTGLPETPMSPNHPWIMDPGTHRAHIMITPLSGERE